MLITGGSRGIGAATAQLAAQRGYTVCISYRRNQAAAEAVSPVTAAALLTAAKRLEENADALLHAAHRIELTLHPDTREEGVAGLAPLD